MGSEMCIRDRPDTVVLSSVVAAAPAPLPIRNDTSGETAKAPLVTDSATESDQAVLLPLRSVINDFTEFKASPSATSRTLMSLGRGVVLTGIERRGEWVMVGTNDGESVTGFVLESQLERVKPPEGG